MVSLYVCDLPSSIEKEELQDLVGNAKECLERGEPPVEDMSGRICRNCISTGCGGFNIAGMSDACADEVAMSVRSCSRGELCT